MSALAMPTAHECERAVLGGVLTSPERLADVAAEGLEPGDMDRPEHAALWALLLAMHEAGEPIDLVTVPERVHNSGRADAYGGVPYVCELPDRVPSTANLGYYARVVRTRAVARRAIARCWDVEAAIRRAFGPGELPPALTREDLVELVVATGVDREGAAWVFREAGKRLRWKTQITHDVR